MSVVCGNKTRTWWKKKKSTFTGAATIITSDTIILLVHVLFLRVSVPAFIFLFAMTEFIFFVFSC